MNFVTTQSEAPGTNTDPNFEPDTKTLTRSQAVQEVWPYALGIVCGGSWLWAFVLLRFSIPSAIKDVFTTSAATAGLLAGFMLTAASILASIGDKPFLRSAKRAGVYALLVRNLFTAMRWCIVSALASIPAVLFDPGWKLRFFPYAIAIWLAVSATAIFLSFRALKTFVKLMAYIAVD